MDEKYDGGSGAAATVEAPILMAADHYARKQCS